MTTAARELALTFAGERAVVTGAASGIGRATVDLLVASGIQVLAIDLRAPQLVSSGGASSIPAAADVRDREELQRAFRALPGAPAYVVNCAGILDRTGFAGVTHAAFQRVLDVNLLGAYQVIDIAGAAGMLRSAVNVTSVEASRVVALSDPDPHPAYAASKAALAMLTRTAARAFAASGARVNSVAPGFVATPMAAAHGEGDELPDALRSRVPLGRFAQPRQIAEAIAFLLSDQAAYITGAELVVDGGFALT